MNFFQVCIENAERLQERYESQRAGSSVQERDQIDRFSDAIRQQGHIAINRRPRPLQDILASKRYLNVYEWAKQESRKTGKPADDLIRERLKGYYTKRVTFDRSFEGGEEFKYAALNIGGAGSNHYGEYCVVLDNAKICKRYRIGYVQGDSLNNYMISEVEVDEAKLRSECAPDSHKNCLAALKHKDDIITQDAARWTHCLCNNRDYIEVIIQGRILTRHFLSVRITESDYAKLTGMVFDYYRNALSEADRDKVASFLRVNASLQDAGIPLEQVPDA